VTRVFAAPAAPTSAPARPRAEAGGHALRPAVWRGGRAVTAGRLGLGALAGVALTCLAGSTAGAAVMAAGNGIDSLTASQAIAASATALKAEPDILISGTITESGKSVGIDVEASHKGADAAGRIDSQSKAIGFVGTIGFVTLPGKLFIDGGAALWTQAFAGSGLTAAQEAKLVHLVANHWVELTGSDAKSFAGGLGSLTDPAQLAAALTTGNGKLTKGAPTVVRHESVLPITSSKGGTLYLALDGPPVPVELISTIPSKKADVTFEYPSTLSIHAPSHFETLAQIEAAV